MHTKPRSHEGPDEGEAFYQSVFLINGGVNEGRLRRRTPSSRLRVKKSFKHSIFPNRSPLPPIMAEQDPRSPAWALASRSKVSRPCSTLAVARGRTITSRLRSA